MPESSSSDDAIVSESDDLQRLGTRRARALIGWLDTDDALRLLAGNVATTPPSNQATSIVQRAHDAAENRNEHAERIVFRETRLPGWDDHERQLHERPTSQIYFDEGWRLEMVDLTEIRAFQPAVFVDNSAERVANAKAGDSNLLTIALPLESDIQLSPQFDPIRQAWIIASLNPNLRLVGNFAGAIEGADAPAPGFGFFIGALPSFIQVAEYEGRFILRDGYHRAVGLLQNEVHDVPAFVRKFDSIADVLPQGQRMLPQEAFLGVRAPRLPDYLDDSVSAEINLPAQRKLVIVQGLELSVLE